MKHDDLVFLLHMRDAAAAVMKYTQAHSYSDFEAEAWDQAAAVRNLEIIGEAANHVSDETRKLVIGIPWRDIIDFRNVAIHDYMDLDIHIVWNIMTNDIPSLLSELVANLAHQRRVAN